MTMIRKMNTPHSTPDSRPFLRCLFPQTYPPAYAPIPSAAVDITDSIRSVASILVITYAKASTATNIAPHPTQAEIAVDDSTESFLPPKSLLFFISAPPTLNILKKLYSKPRTIRTQKGTDKTTRPLKAIFTLRHRHELFRS